MILYTKCPNDSKRCGDCAIRYDCILQIIYDKVEGIERKIEEIKR